MAKAKKTPGRVDAPDLANALDQVHTGRAILQCYIDTIPDERADDRYVLWAVLAAFDKIYSHLD
jgi:hypothetical protein